MADVILTILGGKRVKVPSLHIATALCRIAVTAIFHAKKFTDMQSGKRHYQFTPTEQEVKYWTRIHELNEADKPSAPIKPPAPVNEYIIQTFEHLMTDE